MYLKQSTMKTKHTKGEWELQSEIAVKGKYAAHELVINFSPNQINCVSVFCSESTPTEEEFANAKLIAAAPELLEALIEINSIIADASNKEDGKVNLGQLAKISINAIKKATE